jgi:hypothetical protein
MDTAKAATQVSTGRVTRWCLKLQTRGKESCRLSPDGKTLIEKGYVRRTFSIGGYFSGVGGVSIDRGRHGAHSGQAPPQMTGFTACVDEVTGTFHREK